MRYSPSYSPGPAATTSDDAAQNASSPWTVTPFWITAASILGSASAAIASWTSRVSTELQTLGRWVFALTRIAVAMSRSAEASTYR